MFIDDKIAEVLLSTNLFKNIHPNVITITGIILNFVIYYFLKIKEITYANVLIFIRCICDTMDGAVARAYKKQSELGGYLDTIDDVLFVTIYTYFISNFFTKDINAARVITAIVTTIHIYTMRDALSDHSSIKEEGENTFDNLIAFITNNSIFVFLFIIILNKLVLT